MPERYKRPPETRVPKPWLWPGYCLWHRTSMTQGFGYVFVPYINADTEDADLRRGDGKVTDVMRLRVAC